MILELVVKSSPNDSFSHNDTQCQIPLAKNNWPGPSGIPYRGNRMINGKNLFLIIGVLYITLWLIDIHKAKEVLGGVVGIGESIVQNILLIKNKFSPKPAAKTTPVTLSQFLATPNQELLKIRNGFYNQPAGYYIEVNSDKGTCTAKYSKEHCGRWITPAKILCPQVKQIWGKGSTPQK